MPADNSAQPIGRTRIGPVMNSSVDAEGCSMVFRGLSARVNDPRALTRPQRDRGRFQRSTRILRFEDGLFRNLAWGAFDHQLSGMPSIGPPQ